MTEEIDLNVLKNTQKVLGKHIKKPPLTDKLLKKPPFRFLHDIVTSVIKETGFLKGLFSESELHSDNVKEREAKIAFLTKLIDAVKVITENDLQARPSKIISGLEPVETNLLLQAIGQAIDKKLDSAQYVAQIKGIKEPSKTKSKTKPSPKNETDRKEKVENQKKTVSKTSVGSHERPRIKKQDSESSSNRTDRRRIKEKDPSPRESRSKTKEKISPKEVKPTRRESLKNKALLDLKPAFDLQKESLNDSSENHDKNSDKNSPRNVNGDDSLGLIDDDPKTIMDFPMESVGNDKEDLSNVVMDKKNELNLDKTDVMENLSNNVVSKPSEEIRRGSALERPKSARPRSGDKNRMRPPSAKSRIVEIEKDVNFENSLILPSSTLRPPSVRPTSARPGAPRLRPDSALPLKEMIPMGKINVIVENYNTKDDEEETVVIQSAPDIEPDPPVQQTLDIPADKGHLVEQILEQLQEGDVLETPKSKTDIDWEQDAFRGRDATNKEISQLREAIQTLTRTANPLGKLINFLHEDLEAMHLELNTWISTNKQIKNEINNQKKINEDMTKPLKTKLLEIEDNIKKQEDEIAALKSEIFRNDARIKELLIDQI